MIKNKDGEKVLEFGTGDICVMCVGNKPETELYGVTFMNIEGTEVGAEKPEYSGLKKEDLPTEVTMTFSDPSSIDVVVEHLEAVKASLLEEAKIKEGGE